MNESRQLRDTFADPESRYYRTVVAIDMVDSNAMKEKQPQATWLSSLGWLYDMVRGIATQAAPDVVIKYLGDGIMWVVDTDHTTDAVNAVVQMQEAIEKAGKGSGGTKGVIDFNCCAAVSTGEVVGFATPGGDLDFIGTVVDKAFRLCAAASAKAIFIDTPTVGAANMIRIRSEFGRAVGRTSDQYQGDVQRAALKGFDQPVAYHEILWDQQLHRFKSAAVTPMRDLIRPVPRPSSILPPAVATGILERRRGAITYWSSDKDFGFARDPGTGEEFHVSSRLLVYRDDARKLTTGREIAFVASGTSHGDKKREAGAVLVVGEPADGALVSLPVGKTYGWVRVEDAAGNRHPVYVPAHEVAGHKVGDILGFTVSANDKGACARQVEQVEDDESEAAA